jgi:hypothetical protein
MSGWQVRPEAVDQAVAWLRENDARFTEGALVTALREQGYAEAEIAAALARRREEEPRPHGTDMRAQAAVILIAGFLVTWVLLTIPLVNSEMMYGMGTLASLVLGGILGLIGLVTLAVIAANKSLKRGAEGALVAVLAVPFVLLFAVAGLCVITTSGSW